MPWSDQPITQVIDRYQSAWFAHRVDAAGNDEQVLTLLKHHLIACISSQKSNSTTELPSRSSPSRRVPTTPLDPPAPKPRTPTPARSATSSTAWSPSSHRKRADRVQYPVRCRLEGLPRQPYRSPGTSPSPCASIELFPEFSWSAGSLRRAEDPLG